MHKLKLDDMWHKDTFLWFSDDGRDMFYGPSEENLIYPEGLELMGQFPLCQEDVLNAFRLGLAIGKGG